MSIAYNRSCGLWTNTEEHFYRDKVIHPIRQQGPRCVATTLAMLTATEPERFYPPVINTQDPVSWSEALRPFGMKLAYCPADVRKLRFYMDELVGYDDLFLLCYYTASGEEILSDPDETGWVCGSHVVILHRDRIIDPASGTVQPAREHVCNHCHTKRIFRVVPSEHPRGL
ncbi:MAG: hypothetical protein KatS3mg023_0749 [Armatimonadota bacterium]|nr:MAG: hypothetical protein KatS3mg023_0749 [Armatimonadota bacterium]